MLTFDDTCWTLTVLYICGFRSVCSEDGEVERTITGGVPDVAAEAEERHSPLRHSETGWLMVMEMVAV